MINSGDTAWMLISSALVMLMTPAGLTLFYGGLTQRKSVLNTIGMSYTAFCTASVVWVVIGYSIAFSGDGAYFGNFDNLFLKGIMVTDVEGTIPKLLFVFFQGTFAAIAIALVSGSIIERVRYSTWFVFSILWVILVYSPVTHWVWGGGWLANLGVMDFAGGLVVHTTAGISALVIAKALGNRTGFPNSVKPPHSPVIAMVGASMLWVGWFGFNAGSALSASQSAGMAMLVTHISAAAATLTWMFIDWYKNGKPGLVGMITGMIAGLATVTPASGFIGPLGGLILGISSGIVCYWFVGFIKNVLSIDDSLDVFAVHGVGGILGTLLCGVLASSTFGGLGLDGDIWSQTKVQVLGIVSISIYTLIATSVIVYFVNSLVGLRVSEQEENTEGCDFGTHGESSYHL